MLATEPATGAGRPLMTSDFNPARTRDVLGRLKVSHHQNIYDADFTYSPQPLRWESINVGGGSITHVPGEGGVRMRLSTAAGDINIRQSRPYHRYQPGKTMYMATAVNFGQAQTNQVQRVGFFDGGNGVFFEQADPTADNPSGMFVVIRSDANGAPNDQRFALPQWNGDRMLVRQIEWTRIQMLWIEYAWYGAGAIRWGIMLDGEPYVLHQVGIGNRSGQARPWSRTGNLPVRYEQRNVGAVAAQNDMVHYGVSVLVEGGIDDQRGFTYSYGLSQAAPRRTVAANTTRFPVLSIRNRTMGVTEFTQASAAATGGTTTTLTVTGTPWTVNQWAGRSVFFPGLGGGNGLTARILSNTNNTLTFADVATGQPLATAPGAGANYSIGYLNRGQILPRRLMVSASALCIVELIASTPTSPVALTGANFQALSALGAANSFAERDVSATALTGGEVVFAFTAPAGGSGLQDIDLSQLFPLMNTIRGNVPDILTVAISTPSAAGADVGAHFIAQEAMS